MAAQNVVRAVRKSRVLRVLFALFFVARGVGLLWQGAAAHTTLKIRYPLLESRLGNSHGPGFPWPPAAAVVNAMAVALIGFGALAMARGFFAPAAAAVHLLETMLRASTWVGTSQSRHSLIAAAAALCGAFLF